MEFWNDGIVQLHFVSLDKLKLKNGYMKSELF